MVKMPGVGVGVLVEKDGKVLMLRRRHVHGDGTWSTPGGYLEFGETPEECGIREVYEETGVTVINPRFIALTNDVFEEAGKHSITFWFACDYESGIEKINDPREMDKVGWFSKDELPKPLFLPLENLLQGRSYPSRVSVSL